MKPIAKLLTLGCMCLMLVCCGGGGGSAGCSLAVGALACSGSSGNSSNNNLVQSPSPSSTYQILHSMSANSEGANPISNLVEVNGVYYGTNLAGGTNGLGSVFSITPAGQLTLIHSFTGGAADGAIPSGGLVLGSDGNLYGTTTNGGSYNSGSIYKVIPGNAPIYSGVVFSFGAVSNDGVNPYASLVQGYGSDHAFYGTTKFGGTNNLGTIFKITLLNNLINETVIYSFSGAADGQYPQSNLIVDSTDTLYGTAPEGGASGFGSVFSMSTGGAFNLIYSFAGPTQDGQSPFGALVQDTSGTLYGTTSLGGLNNLGTIFSCAPTSNSCSVMYNFGSSSSSDGSSPNGSLILKSGVLYGTSSYGGNSNNGTIFALNVNTLSYSIKNSFQANNDGAHPNAGLLLASNGYFYGTTLNGSGTYSSGTVFKFYP
jgi:uncharacterized repeat protein (TIGR03803 family)